MEIKNEDLIVVQIGANRGNDHLTELLKDKKIEKLILVEPFEEHNNSLQNCYFDKKNFVIENIIITDKDDIGECEIYYHEEDSTHENKFELASLNKKHSLNIRSHYNESGLKFRTLPCLTLMNLFKKHNLKKIDILYIDTEGFDDKLIKSIDFENILIEKIFYENLHINKSEIREYFINKNFEVIESVDEPHGWSDLAINKNI
jgi:FkbM family methyltransferase